MRKEIILSVVFFYLNTPESSQTPLKKKKKGGFLLWGCSPLHKPRNYLLQGNCNGIAMLWRHGTAHGLLCISSAWARCHMNPAVARQPCLETRWYGLEIMSVKERVKRCTHAQIFCTLKQQRGLAERSCYSIRMWTSANGRRKETEIMRVGTQLGVCASLHYLWSLLISCQRATDDIWLPACLRGRGALCNQSVAATLLLSCLK